MSRIAFNGLRYTADASLLERLASFHTLQTRGLKNRKSRSGGCQVEVWSPKSRSRGHEGFWAAFGAAGHTLDHPGGVRGRLGASWGVVGPSPGRIGGPGGRLWGVFMASEAMLGRLGASNGSKMKQSIILHVVFGSNLYEICFHKSPKRHWSLLKQRKL